MAGDPLLPAAFSDSEADEDYRPSEEEEAEGPPSPPPPGADGVRPSGGAQRPAARRGRGRPGRPPCPPVRGVGPAGGVNAGRAQSAVSGPGHALGATRQPTSSPRQAQPPPVKPAPRRGVAKPKAPPVKRRRANDSDSDGSDWSLPIRVQEFASEDEEDRWLAFEVPPELQAGRLAAREALRSRRKPRPTGPPRPASAIASPAPSAATPPAEEEDEEELAALMAQLEEAPPTAHPAATSPRPAVVAQGGVRPVVRTQSIRPVAKEKAPTTMQKSIESWKQFTAASETVTKELEESRKSVDRYTDRLRFLEAVDLRTWAQEVELKSAIREKERLRSMASGQPP